MVSMLLLETACEQEKYEPNLTAAPGGGTVSVYKAYTLTSNDSRAVYGRIVFWKDNSGYTLAQVGLYNTTKAESYTSAIFSGKLAGASTTKLMSLDAVNGETGAFANSKFFVIADKTFYDKLESYNANVKIMVGAATIASGDIGSNADPVAEAD